MIFSETRSIGKSETLNLIALGVGILNRSHLMLLDSFRKQDTDFKRM